MKKLYRSSKTGRIVKKEFALRHKATTQSETVQDKNYWIKRPLKDKEHDWLDDSVNWVQGYADSIYHPHRQLIISALKRMKFKNVIEVGCNAGPNLALIEENFPTVELFGFDINKDSIALAKTVVPTAHLKVGDLYKPPFLPTKAQAKYDVLIADAVLMYIPPKDIVQIMSYLERMAKRIIIIDRFAEKDEVCGHVWGRNYTQLLENMGFKVKTSKITKKEWSTSKNWQKYGRVFIAHR